MNITYAERVNLSTELIHRQTASLDFIILITGALPDDLTTIQSHLKECIRILKPNGLLLIQGFPRLLPGLGVFLEQYLTFKYWFAIESEVLQTTGLPSVHAAVLMFTKGSGRFNINKPRLPHQQCTACQRSLKDWGGKSHLKHPDGYVISDVIKDLPIANNYNQLSKPLLDLLLRMLDHHPDSQDASRKLIELHKTREISGLVIPNEGIDREYKLITESPVQYVLPFISSTDSPLHVNGHKNSHLINQFYDVIHEGDVLDILRQYPDESIDLAFADPPYNLEKDYNSYADGQAEKQYIEWCNAWLAEYMRILKPTGSLFVLNLPRWGMHHAKYLNQYLHFQNWIVWDALSEPRGKIMPAHYALLFYTKHPTDFTFNYSKVSPIDARHYCLRASCIQQRKRSQDDDKTNLTDIWWDIHRIKHRRDRDYHPCQLPESLLERIIKLASNPGDVVLDAFGGAGSAVVTANRLDRRYVAIDIDPKYVDIMRNKVRQVAESGAVLRTSVKQQPRTISKKALQLELQHLAMKLKRLPTPEDVEKNSQYSLNTYLTTFTTWGKALKAAKLRLENHDIS